MSSSRLPGVSDRGGGVTGPGFEALVDALFPFHFAVADDLRVQRAGPTLAARFPAVRAGARLGDLFEIERPALPLDHAALRGAGKSLVVLRLRQEGVRFRGQFLWVEESSSVVFFGGPWISDLGTMVAAGLELADFPPHDPRGDLLLQAQVRKTMQLDLAERQRRIEQAEEQKAELQRHLDQVRKTEVAAQVAGGLAHNFNNLLTLMHGHAELAAARLRAGDAEGALQRIRLCQVANEDAAALIRQLRNLSVDRAVEVRPVDLHQALERTRSLVQPMLGSEVVWEIESALPGGATALCDPNALGEVLVNLAINAAEAMSRRGRIHTSLHLEEPGHGATFGLPIGEGRVLCLRFADTGPGFGPEPRARAFEPFFTTKRDGHSGLGLATVERLVTLSGGLIRLVDARGAGACFEVRFPAAQEEPEARRRRVMVVDDEPAVLDLVTDLLAGAGYSVESFSDPLEALRAWESGRRFDVIVSDVRMPRLEGPEMVRRIEAVGGAVPTVFISGFAGGALESEAPTSAGPRVLLGKPFSGARLRNSIESLLLPAPSGN